MEIGFGDAVIVCVVVHLNLGFQAIFGGSTLVLEFRVYELRFVRIIRHEEER